MPVLKPQSSARRWFIIEHQRRQCDSQDLKIIFFPTSQLSKKLWADPAYGIITQKNLYRKIKNHMIENLNLATTQICERFRGYLPVVVDVETAGFDPQKNALLEIGAYFIDLDENGVFRVGDSLHFNVKPFEGAEINSNSVQFIGIDPFDPLREAGDEADVIKEFSKAVSKKVKEKKCTRAIMVAHNAHFDHSFIMNAVNRCNYKRCPFHPFSSIDTASLAMVLLGHTVLSKACEIAGIEYDTTRAHGALYDAGVTAELFCKMLNSYGEMLIALQTKGTDSE